MKMTQRNLRPMLAGILAAASFACSMSTAEAGKPASSSIDQSGIDPALSAMCGSAVAYHTEATFSVHRRGNAIVVTGVWKVTYTDVESGRSATSNVLGQSFGAESEVDGFLIVNVFHSGPTMLKGERGGVAWIEAGRVGKRMVFDSETGELLSEETVFDAGASASGGLNEALCALLSE